eukprot:CAMPEP_0170614818 /NCGR_PEP_ID=MMETSP0224-20130122/25007_1 /TAXON_ID=285029 /ORGANISM="Togula jolla, Strain CCCM 725" /LENGTH=99 /DNA_ID=CAMNT_0010940509 /DNA_START=81 /DNA_END=380 /DNA_ORIENTATION=+
MKNLLRAALLLGLLVVVEATGNRGGGLPPWWIMNGVKPEGEVVQHGTYTTVSFSEEQQRQFGVDEQGAVVDRATFDAAMKTLKEAKKPRELVDKQNIVI